MEKSRLIQCTTCNGTGEITESHTRPDHRQPCTTCLGAGTVEEYKPIPIIYPPDPDCYYRRDRHDIDYDEDI